MMHIRPAAPLAIALALGVSACAPKTESTPVTTAPSVDAGKENTDPFPAIDLRSPDTVVKSHWLIQDWMERNGWRMISSWKIDPELQKYFDASLAMSTGERLSNFQSDYDEFKRMGKDNWRQSPPIFRRDILEIKNESETRAVVLAKIKNVTPIPNDRKLDEWNKEQREYGLDAKYVIEKTPDGWRMSQAWKRDSSSIKLAKISEGESDAWSRVWSVKPTTTDSDISPGDFHFSQVSP